MSMIWTPAQLLLLLCVAIVIAFFIASELIESKRVRRPVRILAESEHAASAMRHLPRASRSSPQGASNRSAATDATLPRTEQSSPLVSVG